MSHGRCFNISFISFSQKANSFLELPCANYFFVATQSKIRPTIENQLLSVDETKKNNNLLLHIKKQSPIPPKVPNPRFNYREDPQKGQNLNSDSTTRSQK
jgi:hypothetical protein